jgi:adenylate kinase family enzyme
MLFGIPGSGKSTFSLRLSEVLDIPVYHLDRYFFIDNWVERDPVEFLKIQQSLVDLDEWIIDGNSTRSFGIRYQRAEVALYFRFNRFLCMWRIFKRLFTKDSRITDRAEGCSERIHLKLFQYSWGYNDRVKKNLEELKKRYPQVAFYELRNSKDLEFLLHQREFSR